MLLSYYFNNEWFEYEPDDLDIKEYLKRTHTDDEILKDYLDTLYIDDTEEDKETLKDYGFDGTVDAIKEMDIEDKEVLVDDIIYDLVEYTDLYTEELKDYFEQEAYDNMEDENLQTIEDKEFAKKSYSI